MRVSGERADVAARSPHPTVWLVDLTASLANVARRALAADGLTVEARPGPGERQAGDVALIGALTRPLVEQRAAARVAVAELAPWRVVAVTDLQRRSALQQLAGSGVHGLILVDELRRALAITVRAVAAGQLCVSEQVRAAIVRRPLSARERQILAMVIMGLTNGEISQRLHLAESTVKSHLASTFDKLGVRSRAEAAELVRDPQEMLATGIVGLTGGSAS